MTVMRKKSKSQIVFSLLAQGADIDVIARRVGWTLQQVRVMRCRWKKPEQYRDHGRSLEEILAARQARIEKRIALVRPLLSKGMSWQQAADHLGVSKGVIAGLAHRHPEIKARKHTTVRP
jgi:hypothetical protein